MIYLTRRETFCAAHKLYRKEWSKKKNLKIFGQCANPNWHGHNYELVVTVKGEINPETGFVINLRILSKIIRENVIRKVDHKNLNLDVKFMKNKITSTENLAIAIWNELNPSIKKSGCQLHRVTIKDTENNVVEYTG